MSISGEMWTAIGAVLVALISGVVAMRARKVAPYEALAQRVSDLEGQVEQLRELVDRLKDEAAILRRSWSAWAALMMNIARKHGEVIPDPPEPLLMEHEG